MNLLESRFKRDHLAELDRWAAETGVRCKGARAGLELHARAMEIYKPFEGADWFMMAPSIYNTSVRFWDRENETTEDLLYRPLTIGAIAPGEMVRVPPGAFWEPHQAQQFSIGDLAAAYNRLVPYPALEFDNIISWLDGVQHHEARQRGWFDGFADAARASADQRAKDLLLSHLDPEQRNGWIEDGQFHVHGSAGGEYEIDEYEVRRLSDDHSFCLQIVGEMTPIDDAVLMRKLLLETNEPEFLRIANDLDAPIPENPVLGAGRGNYGDPMLTLNAITERWLTPMMNDTVSAPRGGRS